jgi:uncharacterized membrane protein
MVLAIKGGTMRALFNRPYLLTGIAVALVCYFASATITPRVITRLLIGWDVGVFSFLCLSLRLGRCDDPAEMRKRACAHDAGSRSILLVTLLASIFSVGALIAELSDAKAHPTGDFRVALAAVTVVLSWLFVQAVFAIHYAHVYYLEGADSEPQRGLDFGPEGEPDYWDFVHFSLVMGATAQTADISYTSRQMRRMGSLHTVVAFGFNTAILATMINLAANFL